MHTKPILGLIACAAVASFTLPASAAPKSYADITAVASPASVKPGGTGKLVVSVKLVNAKTHINANKPADPFMIPTVFTPGKVAGVTFGAPIYPKAQSVTESYSTKALLVYKGTPTITVPFKVAKTAPKKPIVLTGSLKIQGCDDKSCYPPVTQPVSVTVAVK
ncbi:MAG TPA: protein-disulfide reductase DsbD domain-containing protein [Capsulimonadaceae bacterium]|jgi:thiol:disulfide interchange protein DsbD